MKRNTGFTLVELLVVIAIISILAAIVVPQVSKYIERANMTKAYTEVQSIELALQSILSETGRTGFSDMLTQNGLDAIRLDRELGSELMYELLRQGRNSPLARGTAGLTINGQNVGAMIQQSALEKMGTQYMDVPRDPWDQLYKLYPGPWRRNWNTGVIQLRCHRANPFVDIDRTDPDYTSPNAEVVINGKRMNSNAYIYTEQAVWSGASTYAYEQEKLPGNPKPDDEYGYPAPKELPFYVWSTGKNMVDDQLWSTEQNFQDAGYEGGGDDINNWDNQQGWDTFYG